MSFEPGALVQLKSGGPAMTVTGESPEGVNCLWYGEVNDAVCKDIIPAICLEPVQLEEEESAEEDAEEREDEDEEDEEDEDEDERPRKRKKKG